MVRDAAMSSAWIQRNPVPSPSPTVPDDHARESFQMATANLGQIAQVQNPTPTRNNDHPRDNTMADEYASAAVTPALITPAPPPRAPGHRGSVVRASSFPPVGVDASVDLPGDAVPHTPATRSGDGRERLLDVLRARGLRFRDGARWQSAL
uniref:Uncharacterized protein sis1 n=1 Tax=Micromonospora inyonensis TaxID=47866 RepID=C9W367_9ACTN|nr:hypothetical protein [Micromonospora inyonensis]